MGWAEKPEKRWGFTWHEGENKPEKKYTTLWCSRQLLHTETNKGLHFKITSCPRKSHIAVPNYFSAQTSLRASWAPLIQLKAALFNLHGNNRSNDDSRILDAACSEKKNQQESAAKDIKVTFPSERCSKCIIFGSSSFEANKLRGYGDMTLVKPETNESQASLEPHA